jgi:hypothetical protein
LTAIGSGPPGQAGDHPLRSEQDTHEVAGNPRHAAAACDRQEAAADVNFSISQR